MLIKNFNILRFIKIHAKIVLLIILTCVAISCNSGGTTEAPPAFVQFVQSPTENEVLNTNTLLFMWRGSDDRFQFRYRLLAIDSEYPSDYIDWSPFSNLTEIEFKNLDEGKYRFELEGQSLGFLGSPLTRTFSIDAVKGPSVAFNKIETTSSVGKLDSVSIWMEDIDSLTAFRVVINFNPTIINLVSVNSGKYVTDNGFSQIILPDFSNQNVVSSINATGKIDVNSAVLTTFNSYPNYYINGSGKILNLKFIGIKTGTTDLEFSTIELKKIDGTTIVNGTPGKGFYIIK